MNFYLGLGVSIVSGLYTSLWGAFKDSPYEDFKPRTFPRSIYFHVVIFAVLYFVPIFEASFSALGWVQIFFLIMGLERFLAELYKGFFRTEDQDKYFVPSRITFFGRYVASDLLRYADWYRAGAGRVCRVVDSRACDDILGVSPDGLCNRPAGITWRGV